jgi:acyl-CoA synthetase (AMP-forming)/AMP-acid ligase II
MTLQVSAPTDPHLAQEYRSQGLWTAEPLRTGVERVAESDGSRLAIIDNDGSWTYAELRERVEAGVGTLTAAGVEPGESVVIVAPNSRDAVATILATVRASGVAVTVDRRCGALDLGNAIAASGARYVVVPDELRSALRVDAHPVTAFSPSAVTTGRPVSDWTEPDPAQPRYVVFTSGTTRRSKGAIHTLETMGAACRNLARAAAFTEQDRFFLSSPVATITGLSQVLLAVQGGSVLLEDRFDAARSLARIERYRAMVIGGAPVIAELLFAEYDRQGLTSSSLQRISLGGTAIPRAVLEVAIDRFGIKPTRVYGSSEVPTHTCSSDGDTLEQRLSDDGVPLSGSECRLGDEYAEGHELQVRGPNMFQGYLYPEDNEGAFVDGWFRTGDLVGQPEGRLRVLGRLKDVAVRKGLKISLAEVDDAALTLTGVIEAAAYSVPDEETGEHVTVALRLTEPRPVSYHEVVSQLLAYGLARGKLPEEVVVWDEPLPRNASGKILRARLREQQEAKWRDYAPRLRVSTSDSQRG